MINRAFLLSCVTLLAFLIGFPAAFGTAAEAQPEAGDTPQDMGLRPSDEQRVREAADFLQAIMDRVSDRPSPLEATSQQEEPPTFLGKFGKYLRDNPNAWYVVLTKLTLAGALGLLLAVVYRASYTGKKKKYSQSMMQSQLLLCIGGAVIWVLVANYLVRAFGLAGMVGLIRYRTPVRDPKDNVMVFLSMAVGMACGLGQVTAAVVATLFICLVLFAIYQSGLGKKKKKKKGPEAEELAPAAADQD